MRSVPSYFCFSRYCVEIVLIFIYVFLKYTSEAIWAWPFVVVIYWFFKKSNLYLLQIYLDFLFLLCQFSYCLSFSSKLSVSCSLSSLLAYSCLQYSLIIIFVSVRLLVMFPFSLLILLMWVFSFFSWSIQLKICKFFFPQRTNFWVC